MSASISLREGSSTSDSKTRSAENTTTDPFHTPFDDDHDDRDDEWWNDEENSEMAKAKPTAASRVTQWPVVMTRDVASISKSTQKSIRKPVRGYSVQKPTREQSRQRQRKQNAAAGIKLNTNVSRHHGPVPLIQQPTMSTEAPRIVLQSGCFVDLAALQDLDSQAPGNNGGLWKSIKGILPNKSEPSNGPVIAKTKESGNAGHIDTSAPLPNLGRLGSRRGPGLLPPPLRLEGDLSPCDRPIVIGISIPSASIAHHATSPQTASSDMATVIQSAATTSPKTGIPETPTIIITPSQMPSSWFDPSQNDKISQKRSRATSSVYSRATAYSPRGPAISNVLAIPPMPALVPRTLGDQERKSRKSVRYSSSTVFSEDGDITSARKSRVVSSYTVFEEDESPILARKARAVSISEGNMPIKHTSVMTTADERRSKGWWSYLTSPFLTRRNTLASPRSATHEHPALPSLATAAIKAQESGRSPREWEKSVFSPITPETSTTIASDAWWERQNTAAEVASTDEESGTLPFILAAGEATIMNFGNEAALQENAASDDNLRRRPAIRDKFSAQNALNAGPSTRALEPIPEPSASVFRSHYPQPTLHDLNQLPVAPATQASTNTTQALAASNARLTPSIRENVHESPQPPPYSPPRANYPRYCAVFPPGHPNNLPEPPSPGPVTPGLQQAMSARGGIALAEVPLTPALSRPINLNSRYRGLPVPQPELIFAPPPVEPLSKKARKAEAKRRRYEKEEAIAHKASGLWRGRGCVPKRGCYGRGGAEGRKRRRCWFGLIAGFLAMIILIVVLATTLHHSATVDQPTQWLNLTGFPPIFTGISTIAAPDNPVADTGCVNPTTVWSCSLPKELQQSVSPNQPNQPNFRLQIQWDNSSEANATFANVTGNPNLATRGIGSNAVSAGQFIRSLLHKARQSVALTPSPAAPSYGEQFFLGNTTDGIVSNNKAGELTPFYVSFLSTSSSSKLLKRNLFSRDDSSSLFPNTTASLETNFPPDVNADGTAAPANLLPFPVQQPLRLYDRGLDTEHYGFYNYFNKSIFLKSITALNNANNGEVPDDENGGTTESEASFRCTWSETRFLVQMWTRKGNSSSLVNSTSGTSTSSSSSVDYTANDFTRPGSFPYPITITIDRHGGDTQLKHIYCYQLDNREKPILATAQELAEIKDFGGVAINPAASLFTNTSDPTLGGFDGGTGGCSCQWTNWQLHG